MSISLSAYQTRNGETLLYAGAPDFDMLEALASGPGDIWHSSLDQGYRNAFPEIGYQFAMFMFVNDFDGLDQCVSWRVNPKAFAVRKTLWDLCDGFDPDYESQQMQGLIFGYNGIRLRGATPLYVKGLFAGTDVQHVSVTRRDRYIFYRKNFKPEHALFMLYRKGIWNPAEWRMFFDVRKNFSHQTADVKALPLRPLEPVQGKPTVTYIIPTMNRQDYTLALLSDLAAQTYLPTEVIVVDATRETERDASVYDPSRYPFGLHVVWQTSKGSCRARNEAIGLGSGDFVIFGDDDIRLLPDFVENHIRLLQTYNAGACNGLDIRADDYRHGLGELRSKLEAMGDKRWRGGPTLLFNNANSCVRREHIAALIGNDINYDGGYGEDNDFGMSLFKHGVVVLHNPFSANLHLKPPAGGYRVWGAQARIMGKKRKTQPWELDTPVKWIRPVPSPTIMYYLVKQFKPEQLREYKSKYFFLYLFKGPKISLPLRLLRMPYRLMQFRRSLFYARKLLAIGKRTK
jgi:glycosyltransferase involved in cell wall biosynthesis